MNSSKDEKKKRAYRIFGALKLKYPDAKPLLHYSSPFELLIATILAAQCTDERVNGVTPHLFKKYPDPAHMAAAEPQDIGSIIKPTGFFKNKAKSLKGVSETIEKKFGGKFPETVKDLITLPGVGRKTANVVAGNCFGAPAIMVDTHVRRVSGRLKLSESNNPDKIEAELKDLILEKDQTRFSHVLNFHGRYTCQARRPLCMKCSIENLCPYPEKIL